MTLAEMTERQRAFDARHASRFEWDRPIDEDNLEMLEFLLLSLVGELGETANLVKKIRRGDYSLADKLPDIGEELADMLIYTLKLPYQLGIDLEKAYDDKMKKNMERFKHYERD